MVLEKMRDLEPDVTLSYNPSKDILPDSGEFYSSLNLERICFALNNFLNKIPVEKREERILRLLNLYMAMLREVGIPAPNPSDKCDLLASLCQLIAESIIYEYAQDRSKADLPLLCTLIISACPHYSEYHKLATLLLKLYTYAGCIDSSNLVYSELRIKNILFDTLG